MVAKGRKEAIIKEGALWNGEIEDPPSLRSYGAASEDD
jgi:hypothetical protein